MGLKDLQMPIVSFMCIRVFLDKNKKILKELNVGN